MGIPLRPVSLRRLFELFFLQLFFVEFVGQIAVASLPHSEMPCEIYLLPPCLLEVCLHQFRSRIMQGKVFIKNT